MRSLYDDIRHDFVVNADKVGEEEEPFFPDEVLTDDDDDND